MPARLMSLVALTCLLALPAAAADSTDAPLPIGPVIGQRISDFTLRNCYGTEVSLSDYHDKKGVAIVFLGTECPMAKQYGPVLSELQEKFGDQGIAVLGINSNRQDSMTELEDFHVNLELNYPMLKDVGNRVADMLGADRTPEAFLLDSDRVIRYHGRIDDQYGVGVARDKPTTHELANAIEQLIAGKEIEVPQTEATGCYIGKVKEMEPTGDITYTEHIAGILNSHCVSCHRDKEIGPFTLSTYDDVVGWEDTILEVIDDQRMPPWFATNAEHGKFSNDSRMSEAEKKLIAKWIENGMPQGDPSLLPEPPSFTEGWQIPEPDETVTLAMGQPTPKKRRDTRTIATEPSNSATLAMKSQQPALSITSTSSSILSGRKTSTSTQQKPVLTIVGWSTTLSCT